MAKIKQRRLFWDASPSGDVTDALIYAQKSGTSANFLGDIEAGIILPVDQISAAAPGEQNEYYLTTAIIPSEGNWDFAVSALDDAGNESDPYQHPGWINVPLDVTPPAPMSGGGIE